MLRADKTLIRTCLASSLLSCCLPGLSFLRLVHYRHHKPKAVHSRETNESNQIMPSCCGTGRGGHLRQLERSHQRITGQHAEFFQSISSACLPLHALSAFLHFPMIVFLLLLLFQQRFSSSSFHWRCRIPVNHIPYHRPFHSLQTDLLVLVPLPSSLQ